MSKDRFVKPMVSDCGLRIAHFYPNAWGRDCYGNRVLSGASGYYHNREPVLSGVFVTCHGDSVLAKHKHFLRDLDSGLTQVKHTRYWDCPDSQDPGVINITDCRCLELIGDGRQSKVFLYICGEDKFVIKTFYKDNQGYGPSPQSVAQPYCNEMLQIQQVKKFLGSKLEKSGIFLPHIIMSTPFVMCMEFIDGVEPSDVELGRALESVQDSLYQFIHTERDLRKNPLWRKVYPDIFNPLGNVRTDNFVTTKEGCIFMVDFLKYNPLM